MESVWGYELSGDYANAFIADKKHWIRALPGGLLQNNISHGIAKIAEYLSGDAIKIVAIGHTSSFLERLDSAGIVDELRVLAYDEAGCSAYFNFSSQMRPCLHQFRIYGPRNGLIVDDDQQSVIKLKGTRFRSYIENFLAPVVFANQYMRNAAQNVRSFLANDFHEDSSKKYLIESFYLSITQGAALPIPYREILLTTKIMDEIFRQIGPSAAMNRSV